MSLNNIGSTLNSKLSPPDTYIICAFLSIALYNVLELSSTVFVTFKRRRGLYFWSFLAATWGIAIYSIGFILKDFGLANSITYFYVTLYRCRLVHDGYGRLILHLVLGMIIVNAIILHIPIIILCFGANSPLYTSFNIPYSVYERIQVAIFFVQESIISGLYVYETSKMLHSERGIIEIHGDAGKRLLLYLILISVTVLVLDVVILVLEFAGRYALQTAIKGFIYSVKLKLEFNILNKLVEFVQRSRNLDSSLIDGSGSRHSWNTQQEEEVRAARRHQLTCPLAVFARRVHRELGISREKYISRVTHLTKKRSGVSTTAESG
ncbi:uncharacterized protein N7483_008287 [Penicillium malachiteum]|uniref:uncharacterized protein n=1 Tax=Penicillium malachiteum TaxID=1324776 RepID=UPI002547FE0B|nr:uncharacterized protein N7483_008287 [Penicillium malachiteum]KAJ5720353.1 integral membrane protein [Penicillium malachiteum]